jgi:hypothetical protein
MVFDSVRSPGFGYDLNTNTDLAVGLGVDSGTYGSVTAFQNGYVECYAGLGTVGNGGHLPEDDYDYNRNVSEPGKTYVGWMWKKGVTAGFDVVRYTGNGASQNVPHALSAIPKMIWIKNNSTNANWAVYFYSLPIQNNLNLNLNSASTNNGAAVWNNTAPTTSNFTVGSWYGVNENEGDIIAYLWSEVLGFSKFGTYIGNSSTDGPFMYCGFRPAYVLVKCISQIGDWAEYDSARNKSNPVSDLLLANSSGAESVGSSFTIDFTATGFKITNSSAQFNNSGQTYMFAAFAEAPTKFALAR